MQWVLLRACLLRFSCLCGAVEALEGMLFVNFLVCWVQWGLLRAWALQFSCLCGAVEALEGMLSLFFLHSAWLGSS